MNKKPAIIYICTLIFFALLVPVLVITKSAKLKSGYKSLPWGKTENQVLEWTKSHSNRSQWNRCSSNHFGISCWRLSWKNSDDSPFEYIEFQFQDGKLCAVIETNHKNKDDPAKSLQLGHTIKGTDLSIKNIKIKGQKYSICERVFYYRPLNKWNATKMRHAVERIVCTKLFDSESPEKTAAYQLTTGYYEPAYYEQIKENYDFFPTFRFFSNVPFGNQILQELFDKTDF